MLATYIIYTRNKNFPCSQKKKKLENNHIIRKQVFHQFHINDLCYLIFFIHTIYKKKMTNNFLHQYISWCFLAFFFVTKKFVYIPLVCICWILSYHHIIVPTFFLLSFRAPYREQQRITNPHYLRYNQYEKKKRIMSFLYSAKLNHKSSRRPIRSFDLFNSMVNESFI